MPVELITVELRMQRLLNGEARVLRRRLVDAVADGAIPMQERILMRLDFIRRRIALSNRMIREDRATNDKKRS